MPEDKKILGLQKNVFILGLTSLFNDFSSEMVLSIFPAFFTSVLKTGAASLGLVEGIADAASNFIKIASGNISDRIQKRRIFVIIGYTVSVLTRPFYVLAGTLFPVLALRLSDRVGKGLRDSPRDALISLSVPNSELGMSFGYHRAMDTIGAILGPLCAYFILRAFPYGFNMVFLVAFLVGILALATLFFIKETVGAIKAKNLNLKNWATFSPKFKSYLFSSFILSIGTLPIAVLLLKTKDLGLLVASIPLYYMISNIAFAVFSYVAGRYADKIGAGKVLIGGYLFLILGYAVLMQASGVLTLILGFILIGFFFALTDGIHRSYTAHLTPEATRASAYGWLNGLSGLGALLAGIIGGYLWQRIGDGKTLLIGSVIVIVGLFIFCLTQFKKSYLPAQSLSSL
jgi:MFS family permease